MSKNVNFEKEYSKLNKEQKDAVDSINGPVMVIAGPGTGKTTILTLRIANILRLTDTSPSNILALTFTESGAYTMKKKLIDLIGPSAYKININTFHSFCNEIIKDYPERFPRIIGSTLITEIDQIAIIEKIIEKNSFEKIKPYGDIFYYVSKIISEIKNLKRETINSDDLKEIIRKQKNNFDKAPDKIHKNGAHKGKMKGDYEKLLVQIEKNEELATVYEEYEKTLEKMKFYDFEDMIIEVVKTLKKDKKLLLILQENYQYILADEHQDTNNSQNEILRLLSNFDKNPNLFIVGDEKQAIFRFQGASLQNFLYFQKIYPNSKIIHLVQNYRSTQSILDASHSLILKNNLGEGHTRIRLISNKKEKEPIHIYEFEKENLEHLFVAREIEQNIKNGTKEEEIAILYNENKDSREIADTLKKAGIPFKVESDNDILQNEDIRKIIWVLEAINDTSDEEKLSRALFADFWGHNSLDLYEFFAECKKNKKKISINLRTYFPETGEKIAHLASYAKNKTLLETFEMVIKETGYLTHLFKTENTIQRIETLEIFFEWLKDLANTKKEYFLSDFIEHIDRIKTHGIFSKTKNSHIKNGIRLMTAHKSKGLEFDYVYIIGANEGHWSNKKDRKAFHIPIFEKDENENKINDERRLFYVAITRARKKVCISYSRESKDKKELLPTEFIGEIADDMKFICPLSEMKKIENELEKNKKLFEKPLKKINEKIENKEYLQKLFIDQGFSITALNNYLKCPWQYFFVNLIRVPSSQSKQQIYGTAIHKTLETFFNKYKIEEYMSKKDLIELFEFNLKKMPLFGQDFEETLKKGQNTLQKYFENYQKNWNKNLITEYKINGVHFKVKGRGEGFNLTLTGKLDKIELLDERNVNVVDYKTGKEKSRKKITGENGGDGNYKRQLIFYKLLLDLDEKKKFNMVSGEIDFIEPNEKGINRKEKFEIGEDEVETFKKSLNEKALEIYNLDFINKTCDAKDCEYCKWGGDIFKQ